jgi:hypothetical protein
MMLLFCLLLTWPPQAFSQQTTRKPQKIEITNQSKQTTEELQKGTINPRKTVSRLPGFIATPPDSVVQAPQMIGEMPAEEPIWMEFALDWTNCQIHRVGTDSAIVIILPGTISSSNSIYWNLNTISPQPGGLPVLYFVGDVLGRTGPGFGRDIPLIWEISVDGGPFNPITIQPDSSLSVNFASGNHNFQVRITGAPPSYQGDGYYQLLLGQSLVPEL